MHERRTSGTRVFHLVLIKPSHYDDDGYVIQWVRSSIPSNTLAILYGLALDCAERRVLGEGVDLRLHAHDETNTRIDVARIVRLIRSSGDEGLVALVGVQSNQFPRAMDLARQFRAERLQVCIGGFHVSGCLAMLPALPGDLQEALDLGVSLFAGELEGRMEVLLRDDVRPLSRQSPRYSLRPGSFFSRSRKSLEQMLGRFPLLMRTTSLRGR